MSLWMELAIQCVNALMSPRSFRSTRYLSEIPRIKTSTARARDAAFLDALLKFWRDGYDWRTHEAQILGLPWQSVGTGNHGLRVVHPSHVTALHLTNISPLHSVFVDRSVLDADDLAYLDKAAIWQRREGGYIAQQSTKPHTLAPGLADSPAGLAAWLVEKLQGWSETPFSDETLLTWISAYCFTGTIGTSFTPYIEFVPPVPYVSTPTVISAFAHDTKPAPRGFASRFVNVREWIEHEKDGHHGPSGISLGICLVSELLQQTNHQFLQGYEVFLANKLCPMIFDLLTCRLANGANGTPFFG